MMILVALQMAWTNPIMNQLGRSFDFLPLTAALKDRENYQSYTVWYTVLEFLKLFLGLALGARLLFDRYAWEQKLAGGPQRVTRRRRRHSSTSGAAAGSGVAPLSTSATGAAAGTDSSVEVVEPDLVDKAHDSHVDG